MSETKEKETNDLYSDLYKKVRYTILYKHNDNVLEKEYHEWRKMLCEKYPNNKHIADMKDLYISPQDIYKYLKHFEKLNFSEDSMKEAIKQLHARDHLWFESLYYGHQDVRDMIHEYQISSCVLNTHIVDLISENKRLKQEVIKLSNENTELLLRPEGPICIELGKKFLLNSSKQQS